MKNPELGINSDIPNESSDSRLLDGADEEGESEEITEDSEESRFSKLRMIDEEYQIYKQKDYKNRFNKKQNK